MQDFNDDLCLIWMTKQLKWEGKSIFEKSFMLQNLSFIMRLIGHTFTLKKQVSTFSLKKKWNWLRWSCVKSLKKVEFQHGASAYVLSYFCTVKDKIQRSRWTINWNNTVTFSVTLSAMLKQKSFHLRISNIEGVYFPHRVNTFLIIETTSRVNWIAVEGSILSSKHTRSKKYKF